MGIIEVRNPLLSKKLKRTETRLLIIDDNQIRYNKICELLQESDHQVHAYLLDDLKNFEKQLHLNWDLILFGQAYDLKVEQALPLIRSSKQPNLPLLLLKPSDYEAEKYTSYIRKGVFDILNLEYTDRFYLGLIRALSFSRLQQAQEHLMEELETAQTQAQSLVEDSHKAVAIIQEGIHVNANPEYLELFGFKNEDEIIGLPLLDLLQPNDLNDFKLRFKKISQGQFDLGRFDISTANELVASHNPLKLEFLPSSDDDALQITIDTASSTESASGTSSPDHAQQKPVIFQQINRTVTKQPSDINALVIFSLNSCPDEIFKSDWLTSKNYFKNMKEFIKEQTNVPLFSIDTSVVAGLFQAESKARLESKLIGLSSLGKPQLLNVNQATYPLNLRIGYTLLESEIKDEHQFEQLIAKAYTTALPQNQGSEETLKISLDTSDIELFAPQIQLTPASQDSTLIKSLRSCLEKGDIHLKYQQLYDKEDSNLYTYEVTSGFIFENTLKPLSSLMELAEDPELSIKLDRWILVESCKQLHNFITQYPDAKLIVNLNKHVLLQDKTFPEFIAKLITIIGSKQSHPLILQFAEEDINQHQIEAQKQIIQLRQHGAEIAIRDFGNSMYSETILQQIEVNSLTLHNALTKMLQSEKTTEELQEKLTRFNEIKPVQIMLRELNDMTLFANAWNVDARFIQGDYFQKKLDHLIDVQDQ
ncbi:EAL domain-containing protein [Acinetobacter chinensis]|uniref:EAL domain-containing protein n=1 Tax=Acinetobacter chinensis TaxID=2004650 RepID=A0A3B7LWL9_9GAMM|nr:EAL domain-containing protein [Acinetobacter chinensis]AXY56385.1 EAL domain-containing protein [Acinetobacter chinensis]